jgi:hypothetical protein
MAPLTRSMSSCYAVYLEDNKTVLGVQSSIDDLFGAYVMDPLELHSHVPRYWSQRSPLQDLLAL